MEPVGILLVSPILDMQCGENFSKMSCLGSTLSANLLFFSFREDMYSQDSIDLLASSGLQFQKHEEEGIDTLHFAELLMTSGVVLSDSVKWLSFHRWVQDGH